MKKGMGKHPLSPYLLTRGLCTISMQTTGQADITKADCYRFFSLCFYPPRKEVLIGEKVLSNLIGVLSEICPEAAGHAQAMYDACQNSPEQELAVEHAKLFVGPFELKAPPYGSVYLEKERRVMGDSTLEVLRLYQDAGLSMSDDFNEQPDHVSVELEFMHYLLMKPYNADTSSPDEALAKRYKDIRSTFFHNHLKLWVPVLCRNIHENTENTFYSSLAQCLSTFVCSTAP